MFLGHFGIAMAAKKVAPRTPLPALFAASSFVDIIWPVFLLMGIEQARGTPGITAVTDIEFISYPYSHSLVMAIVWGVVVGLVSWPFTKSSRGALVIGLLVASHWFLDLIVHIPDLPLTLSDDTHVGLGLWNSVAGTLTLELLLFGAGAYVYITQTAANDRIGRYGIWGLLVLLVASYIADFTSTPPEDIKSAAYIIFIGTALTLWLAWWVDRHRRVKSTTE